MRLTWGGGLGTGQTRELDKEGGGVVGRGPLASAAWAPGLPARPHDQPLGLRKLRRDSAREIPQWTLYNGHAKQPPLSLGWRGMEGRGDRERAAAERILPPSRAPEQGRVALTSLVLPVHLRRVSWAQAHKQEKSQPARLQAALAGAGRG